MFQAFVKQLIENGGGAFNVVRLEAETESELNTKRDTYLGADFQDATEEDYNAQSAERDERQGTKDGAEIVDEPAPEAPAEAPTEEAPAVADENANVDAEA